MVLDILYSGMIEEQASVEEHRSGERSVASRSPCDAQEQTSVVAEVVPPPSVCSTADGPPRRTSPLPGRHPPPTRTPVPPDGERWLYDSDWRNPCRLQLESWLPPTDIFSIQGQTDPERIVRWWAPDEVPVSFVGSPVYTALWWHQRMCLRLPDGVASGRENAILTPRLETPDRTGHSAVWRARRSRRAPCPSAPAQHSLPSRPGTKPSVMLADSCPIHVHQPLPWSDGTMPATRWFYCWTAVWVPPVCGWDVLVKWCAGVSDISMHTGRGNPGVDVSPDRCSRLCG